MVATPAGVTVTLKYCHVLRWITFDAVIPWDELPRRTANLKLFDVASLLNTMLSLFGPLPKLKYCELSATEVVYAHMPALKPCEKSRKPVPGSVTKVLVPLSVSEPA